MGRNTRVPASSNVPDNSEEMTVVILRVKGGGDTVKKGFEALTSAFASLGVPTGTIKQGNGKPPKQLNAAIQTEDEDDDTPEMEEDEAETTIEASVNSTPASAKPRSKPKFLTDFDLNAGDVNWRDFAALKTPKSDPEKYLLAALWITEKANLPEFTVNHIFSCFRAATWSEQVDFSQPIRQMKLKKSYFSNPSSKVWKLTQPGLDAARAI